MEFSKLFGKYSHLTAALLERMPPMERVQNESQVNGNVDGETGAVDDSPQHQVDRESVGKKKIYIFHYLIMFLIPEFVVGFVRWHR